AGRTRAVRIVRIVAAALVRPAASDPAASVPQTAGRTVDAADDGPLEDAGVDATRATGARSDDLAGRPAPPFRGPARGRPRRACPRAVPGSLPAGQPRS